MSKANLVKKAIFTAIILPLISCMFCSHAEALYAVWADIAYSTADETYIDKSRYTDGSLYDNPPVDVSYVRIGLDFGEEAVQRVVFKNCSGRGFAFGRYNEQREFVPEIETDSNSVSVFCTPDGVCAADADTGKQLFKTEGASALAIVPAEEDHEGITEYCDRRYRGGFECRPDDELLSIVNYVQLEDYVKGVIPYEMSQDWPYEALRAQAVCARTYVVYNQGEYEEYGFDIRDDTYSQVYNGTLDANERTDAAVDSTAGQLVRYKGEICEIYYFAADGGATEDGINVFDTDRPYLRGRIDPFEDAVEHAMKDWRTWRSADELTQRLENWGYSISEVAELRPEYSNTGNVIAISFIDQDGNSVRVAGRGCYNLIGLNSCRFEIVQDDGGFSFAGHGWGHSCGMSQWGANAMASVYGYDCEDIIRFYFTGAYIA